MNTVLPQRREKISPGTTALSTLAGADPAMPKGEFELRVEFAEAGRERTRSRLFDAHEGRAFKKEEHEVAKGRKVLARDQNLASQGFPDPVFFYDLNTIIDPGKPSSGKGPQK